MDADCNDFVTTNDLLITTGGAWSLGSLMTAVGTTAREERGKISFADFKHAMSTAPSAPRQSKKPSYAAALEVTAEEKKPKAKSPIYKAPGRGLHGCREGRAQAETRRAEKAPR